MSWLIYLQLIKGLYQNNVLIPMPFREMLAKSSFQQLVITKLEVLKVLKRSPDIGHKILIMMN